MYLQENKELKNRSDLLEQKAKKLGELMLQLDPEGKKTLNLFRLVCVSIDLSHLTLALFVVNNSTICSVLLLCWSY